MALFCLCGEPAEIGPDCPRCWENERAYKRREVERIIQEEDED